MRSNKSISIIIPAYNAGKSLEKTLGSLIKQSYENFEAIIMMMGVLII